MTNSKSLSVEKIIHKYQNRQERLQLQINQQAQGKKGKHQLPSTRSPFRETALDTPQFSSAAKQQHKNHSLLTDKQNSSQRTHKKPQHFNPRASNQQIACISFQARSVAGVEHQRVLKQLSETEQKMVKSQKAFAQMWRKYQKLLHDQQFCGLQVDIQKKLRRNETSQLQAKVVSLQRELGSYKQLLCTKEGNLDSLKEKLMERSQLLLQRQRQLTELRSSMERRQFQIRQQAQIAQQGRPEFHDKLASQLQRLSKMLGQKQSEKKVVLQQLQKSYAVHRQEMQALKMGFLKVQNEYKQWIQQLLAQKLKAAQQYELRLKQNRQKDASNSYKRLLCQQNNEHSSKREEEHTQLRNLSARQSNELKQLRTERETLQHLKAQFIIKISVLQNNLLSKAQLYDQLQGTYHKLKEQYQLQQQRCRTSAKKYSEINKQFLQLKSKCKVMFQEGQTSKGKANDAVEVIRLRKQLMHCKEQLEKSKNNQFQLSHRFTQTVNTIKAKLGQLQSEKQAINADLLAERLQNVQLKEQLSETRQYLKKQYELSLENTKIQLQKEVSLAGGLASGVRDMSKQSLYCQLRKLQRKCELMNSEVVTRDDMIRLAHKVYKRNQHYKK